RRLFGSLFEIEALSCLFVCSMFELITPTKWYNRGSTSQTSNKPSSTHV
ncbi:hypothetical protein DFA_00002, partial [Cavenderia fasciculata]